MKAKQVAVADRAAVKTPSYPTKDVGARLSGFKILDEGEGIVEAFVSVFGIVDSQNEVVDLGAFVDSLKRKLPAICWSHDWTKIIGKTIAAEEVPPNDPRLPPAIRAYGGLWVQGQLALGTQTGREAFMLLRDGYVDEFSIGYEEQVPPKIDGGVRHLPKVRLFEWSPVLAGANPATSLVGAKIEAAAAADGDKVKAIPPDARAGAKNADVVISKTADEVRLEMTAKDAATEKHEELAPAPEDEEPTERADVLGAIDDFETALMAYFDSDNVDGAEDRRAVAPMLDSLRAAIDAALQDDELAWLDDFFFDMLTAGGGFEPKSVAAELRAKLRGRAKEGRVLSSANYDKIVAAHTALGEVIASATREPAVIASEDDDSAKTAEPAGDGAAAADAEMVAKLDEIDGKLDAGLDALTKGLASLGLSLKKKGNGDA